MDDKEVRVALDVANNYAKNHTGCMKVHVGCVLLDGEDKFLGFGANVSRPNCKAKGICHRVELYGEASKDHRLPSDCNAIHSEIDALVRCSHPVTGGTAVVTRYPCEACARALVQAGIKKIYYGRQQEASELTKQICSDGDVELIWVNDWVEKDVTY